VELGIVHIITIILSTTCGAIILTQMEGAVLAGEVAMGSIEDLVEDVITIIVEAVEDTIIMTMTITTMAEEAEGEDGTMGTMTIMTIMTIIIMTMIMALEEEVLEVDEGGVL